MTHLPVPTQLLDKPVRKAVVIGSGSMGSGIAALIASSGAEVTLLDVAGEGDARNERAEAGRDIQIKRRGFTHPSMAEHVRVGNTTDDLHAVNDADWVVEAIFENLEAKRALYQALTPHLGEETILSSNTSTIPLAELTAQLSPEVAERFYITHFFNPPRVMPLVELIASPSASAERTAWLSDVIEQQLGKTALPCRDTPGFIANRIGNLWMAVGAGWALENEVPIELADAIASRPFGVPRTGIFGLFDYIGLQLVPDVWGSTVSAVPSDDAYHRWNIATHPLITGLIERGLTGRTGPSGFYRGRDEVIGEDFEYRSKAPVNDPALEAKDLRAVLAVDSLGGEYARQVFARTLAYCCTVGAEVADTAEDIDAAMILGYGWKRGPFALADSVGLQRCEEILQAVGLEVPALLSTAREAGGFYPDAEHTLATTGEVVPRRERAGVVTIAALRQQASTEVLEQNEAAVLLQLGSGVGVYCTKTKLGTLNPAALDVLAAAAQHPLRALVIANDDTRAISAGADVSVLAAAAREGDAERFAGLLDQGLDTFRAVKYAPFPVVAALRGVALGGGAEMILHTDALVAHVDAKIGFPERTVGIFPGWGGPIQHLERALNAGIDDAAQQVFDFAMQATPARGAYEAAALGLLGPQDPVLLSADHVFAHALTLAEALADEYTAPVEPTLPRASELEVPSISDEADQAIATELAGLLQGEPASEEALNRESTERLVAVFRHEANRERVATALERIGR